MDKPDIRALTGLRGVAALLVTLYHFYPPGDLAPGMLHDGLGRGYLWVDLFFILSGFVIALNYGHLFADGFSRQSLGTFLLRRVARLYPLYLAILGARVLYTLLSHGNFAPPGDFASVVVGDPVRDLTANLFLVQAWGLTTSIVGTAWSISTEVAVYLLFPLLAAVTLFQGWRPALAAGIAAAALIGAVAILNAHDGAYHSGPLDAYDGTKWAPLLRCLGGFILGLLAFRLGRVRAIAAFMGSNWVSLALTLALAAMFLAGGHDLAIVALFPAFVLALARNNGWPAALFSGRVILRLGVLSYAIYLLHPLLETPHKDLLALLAQHQVPLVVAHGVAGVTMAFVLFAASTAAYEWVERPGRRLVRALERKPARPRDEKGGARLPSAP
jgi:peptidoglycan/LPS O-acetylase OafA/YrhL